MGVERGLPRDCYAGGSRTLSVGASHDFGGKKSYGPGGDGATSDPGVRVALMVVLAVHLLLFPNR